MAAKSLSAEYPTDLPSWRGLSDHYENDMWSRQIGDLFKHNTNRFDGYTLETGDLFLDYSKNIINARTRTLLARLVNEAGVPEAVEQMFSGAHMNVTEDRPALHVALRSNPSDDVAPNVPGVSEIWDTLEQMTAFVNGVHDGEIRGATGRRLTDIVNIGIGGSDLGAVMASRALRHYWQPGMNFHAISNVDGTQLIDLTEQLDPEATLFIICSKTFTTQETMVNAHAASEWLSTAMGGDAVANHFAAASTNHLSLIHI